MCYCKCVCCMSYFVNSSKIAKNQSTMHRF